MNESALYFQELRDPALVLTVEWKPGRRDIEPPQIHTTMQRGKLATLLRLCADQIDAQAEED